MGLISAAHVSPPGPGPGGKGRRILKGPLLSSPRPPSALQTRRTRAKKSRKTRTPSRLEGALRGEGTRRAVFASLPPDGAGAGASASTGCK